MTPKQQALAYRIWAYAKPRQWKVGVADLAEALASSTTQVHRVLAAAGWLERIRNHGASIRAAYESGLHASTGYGSTPAVDTFLAYNREASVDD